MEKYIKVINDILEYNKFNNDEKKEFWDIINPIFNHEEFQKRLNNKIYPHHGNTSLGLHIINDAVVTFKLCKTKYKDLDINLAVLIAMMHDLYELPWQNSLIKKDSFVNKHGFVHPIEAAINSLLWFPEYFKNSINARIIIDGIIHHMFPFPVRVINDFNDIEINNIEKIKLLNDDLVKLIIDSTNRVKVGGISFSRSKYKEGRLVNITDKVVSVKDLDSFKAIKACVTGKNSNL